MKELSTSKTHKRQNTAQRMPQPTSYRRAPFRNFYFSLLFDMSYSPGKIFLIVKHNKDQTGDSINSSIVLQFFLELLKKKKTK